MYSQQESPNFLQLRQGVCFTLNYVVNTEVTAVADRQRVVQHDQDLWDKIWKDKRGKVVIYQNPNWILISWLVLTVISLFTNGTVANVIGYIGDVVLAGWAALEIWKGVNYFRKALGAVVLLLVIASLFKVGY